MMSVLESGGTTVVIVDAGPVVPRLGVANLEVKLKRPLRIRMDIRLDPIVAGPVLRPVHAHITLVDASALLRPSRER